MPRKITPQKRYQNALRVIKKRLKISHKAAQKIYREERNRIGRPLPPTHFRKLKKQDVEQLRLISETILYEQGEGCAGPDGDFSFQIRDICEEQINQRLQPLPNTLSQLTEEIDIFESGVFARRATVVRTGIDKSNFFQVHHDMVREALEQDSEVAVITVKITAL